MGVKMFQLFLGQFVYYAGYVHYMAIGAYQIFENGANQIFEKFV